MAREQSRNNKVDEAQSLNGKMGIKMASYTKYARIVRAAVAVLLPTSVVLGASLAVPANSVTLEPADPVVIPDMAIYNEVVREPAPGLLGYTVYRPADLDAYDKPLPLFAWANGACVWNDGGDKDVLLRSIAHAGFFVVGIGTPAGTPEYIATIDRIAHDPKDLRAALDWALGPANAPDGPYAGRISRRLVGVGGNSCGGRTALAVASKDSRVKTVLEHSGSAGFEGSPATPEEKAKVLRTVRAPIGYIVGGPRDHHFEGSDLDWDIARPELPIFRANHSFADHVTTSTMYGLPLGNEITEIGVNWLKFTLLGDPVAKEYLLGDTFGRCIENPTCQWTARDRHLDSFQPGQLLPKVKRK